MVEQEARVVQLLAGEGTCGGADGADAHTAPGCQLVRSHAATTRLLASRAGPMALGFARSLSGNGRAGSACPGAARTA